MSSPRSILLRSVYRLGRTTLHLFIGADGRPIICSDSSNMRGGGRSSDPDNYYRTGHTVFNDFREFLKFNLSTSAALDYYNSLANYFEAVWNQYQKRGTNGQDQ